MLLTPSGRIKVVPYVYIVGQDTLSFIVVLMHRNVMPHVELEAISSETSNFKVSVSLFIPYVYLT